MSLDTKHDEIAKLEQRSRQHEEALAVRACTHTSGGAQLPTGNLPPARTRVLPRYRFLLPHIWRRHRRRRWSRTRSALKTT